MSNLCLIRRAGIEDAGVLLALSRTTFFEAFARLNEPQNMEAYASVQFTAASISEQLGNPDSEFYFAVVDDQVTGYIKLNRGKAQTEFKDMNTLEVERVYVSAAYQGRQTGRQLVEFAVNEGKRRRLDMIWLGVWEHNTKAINFYQRHGFKIFDKHAFMLGDDRQVDLLMKRDLSGLLSVT